MRKTPILLVAATAATIAVFSLTPLTTGSGTGSRWLSSMEHGAAYAALATTLLLAWPRVPSRYRAVIFTAAVYGAMLELLQVPVPGRTFSLLDITVNTAGASTVLIDRYIPVASTVDRFLP